MLVGEPVCSGFKLSENMQANTPLRSGNKLAHQHDEPWRNILSNFPEKTLTEKEKKMNIREIRKILEQTQFTTLGRILGEKHWVNTDSKIG